MNDYGGHEIRYYGCLTSSGINYLVFQTYIGPVLVSVNPYKTLDIYNDNVIKTYRNVSFYELPPHM